MTSGKPRKEVTRISRRSGLVYSGSIELPRARCRDMPNPQMTSANSERYVAAPASHFDIVKPGNSLNEAFMMIGAPVRFERNTEVYSEEEPAEYFYLVV